MDKPTSSNYHQHVLVTSFSNTMSRSNRRGRNRGNRSNNGISQASSKRTKADDLSYNPKNWVKQKYTICAHFHGTLCQHLLDHTITKPLMNILLASELLIDDSRNQPDRPASPDPQTINPQFWHLTDLNSLRKFANSLDRNDSSRFFGVNYKFTSADYTSESKTPSWGEFAPSSGELHAFTPPEIDLVKAEKHAYQDHIDLLDQATAANVLLVEAKQNEAPLPKHPRAVAAKALQDWHEALATWRTDNPPDMSKHHKTMAAYEKTVLSANCLNEYRQQPQHVQHAMFLEADTMIYTFMNKYIDRKHKHLKNGLNPSSKTSTKTPSGVSLFDRCNLKQAKPSVSSGVHIMNKITRAKQQPGQSFSKYLDYMTDLQDDYQTATGRAADSAIVRVSLIQNLQEFYDTPINGLQTHDNINNTLTPITGLGLSVQSILEKYEADNPAKFAVYQALSSKKKKKKSRSGEANTATSNRSNNNNRDRGNNKSKPFWEPGKMPQQCTWCRTFLPKQPTSHDQQDCRIKAGFVNMTCHNCQQKGHPARMCPHKEGRANSAIESSPTTPQPTFPYGVANYISVSSPMTSKAARTKLKQMQEHNKNRKNDRRVRFRLIEVPAESDDDSS